MKMITRTTATNPYTSFRLWGRRREIFFDSKFLLYLYTTMKIDYIIYSVQHAVGHEPKWERDLIESDTHLKTFKTWMGKMTCKKKCDELYHNRLNYLKGWIR